MNFKPGQLVRATISTNTRYAYTKEAYAFVGLVVKVYNSFTDEEVHDDSLLGDKISVVPLYGPTNTLFSYYKFLDSYHKQSRLTHNEVEPFFEKLFRNDVISIEDFSFLDDLQSYDVKAQYFELIEDTSYASLRKRITQEVQTLHIYERKIDPKVAENTTRVVNEFFNELEHLVTNTFHPTNKPNLSL